MKKYFSYFKWWFLAVAIVGVIACILLATTNKEVPQTQSIRNNDECDTEERVFDYADKLTTEEENQLRQLIGETEPKIGCDIVLVTIEEPLEDYVALYEDAMIANNPQRYSDGTIPIEDWVMIYADNFYEEHKFGYNAPGGDGAVYVDNWYREADGYRYTWFSTTGKVMDTYTDTMISHLMNRVIEKTNDSPYEAYKSYVNTLYDDMTRNTQETPAMNMPFAVVFGVSIFVAIIYLSMNLFNNKGTKTTAANTYVEGGKPIIRRQTDTFLTKHVTKVHIERNTSGGGGGGGGGGHSSSSGGSHGGGGGRH